MILRGTRTTRATIMAPNYAMIQGFVLIVGDEHIQTDALHIFAAQVKHNWGFGPEIVKWAVSRFTDDERKNLGVDGRYIWIQEQRRPEEKAAKGPPKYYDLGPLSQMDLLFLTRRFSSSASRTARS